MIDEKKLIEELTDLIVKHYCKPSGCEDCLCAFEYGIMEESCEDYLEYNKLAKKIYNEFVVKIIDQKPPAVGIDKQKMIEELEKKYHDIAKEDDERWVWWNRAIYTAVHIIKDQPPADQWIPCSERLPVYYDWHHVTVKPFYEGRENYVAVERYDRIKGEWSFHERAYKDKIIAWKPKPEPYKGVE